MSRIPQAYAFIALRRFDEAEDAIRRALELDPLSVVNVYNQAVVAYFAEEWDDLRRFSMATIDRAPEFGEGHLGIGVAAMQAGHFEEALASLEKAVSLNATIGVEYIVTCYCRMKRWDKAEAALERLTALARFSYVAPHRFAVATSAFADPEQCLTHLERAKDLCDPRLIWIAAWPAFAPLRGSPRFQRICRDLGVPS